VKKLTSHDFLGSFVAKSDFLDLQILATITYSSQFEFPLLEKEIFKRLVDTSVLKYLFEDEMRNVTDAKTSPSYDQFQLELWRLVELGILFEHNSYFCFVEKKNETDAVKFLAKKWVQRRREMSASSYLIRTSSDKLIRAALKINWIEAIGITGSVAVRSAKKDDDLDLLIVTKSGTLWIVRLIALLIAVFNGNKRVSFFRVSKKPSVVDGWCLNLWMESNSLLLPMEKQTIFDAFEAIQIDWIYDAANIQERFLRNNVWINDFLVNQPKLVAADSFRETNQLKNYFGWLNRVIYKISSGYLHRKNKIPYKNMKLNQAFLHDGVSHLEYINEWKRLFNQALLELSKSC